MKQTSVLHIPLCQMNYIVPVINKLKDYFECQFYFIANQYSLKSSINMIELQKINIPTTIKIITQEQLNALINTCVIKNEPCFMTSTTDVLDNTMNYNNNIKKIHLSFSHGIDEELIVNGKNHRNPLSELKLNACLYSTIYKNMITEIYKIDENKKTIVFFDTTSIWLFKKFGSTEIKLSQCQNNLLDVLIKLKDKYNIILRFHPQDYYGFISSGKYHCSDKVLEHFIVDYTPMPVFNFYEMADIIIGSRFSASGYQSLFVKNKNFILLETDFKTRQLYGKDSFIRSHNNNKINELKLNGKILSENEVYILHENNPNDLVKIIDDIELNNYECKTEFEKDLFVQNIFNMSRYNFNDIVNCDHIKEHISEWIEK